MTVNVVPEIPVSDSSSIDQSFVALQQRHTELLDFVELLFEQLEGLRSDISSKSIELELQKNELARREETLVAEQSGREHHGDDFEEQHRVQNELLAQLQRMKDDLSNEREASHSQTLQIIERTDQEVQRLREDREQFQEKVFASQNSLAETCDQLCQYQQRLSETTDNSGSAPASADFGDDEREELESELERVRRRAAEMADSLAEHNRQANQRESQWTNELQQVRLLLEQQLVQQVSQTPQHAGVIQAPANVEATNPANPANAVVGSVMEQFAKLQEDAVRRRAVEAS